MNNQKKSYVMLTGATGAIGSEIARALALRGYNLILACRNTDKAEALRQSLCATHPNISISIAALDLSESRAVETCVEHLREKGLCVEALINNAGVMNRRFTVNSAGIERTMAVNYHNTSLLTTLLREAFPATLQRVVFTTSLTRRFIVRKPQLAVDEKSFSQLGTYARSKRAITDFATTLAATHPELRVNCADPGVVDSAMIHMDRWFDRLADYCFRPFIRSPKQGAIPALRAFEAEASGFIFCRWMKYHLK